MTRSAGSPGTGRLRRFAGTAVALGLGLAAFVAVCRATLRVAPPDLGKLTTKVRHLVENDRYTTVVFGTSMIFHGVRPDVVEGELRAAGHHDEVVFNASVEALTAAEQLQMVEAVLAARPRKLRRIVVDGIAFSDSMPQALGTERDFGWHTPYETAGLFRLNWQEFGELPSRPLEHVVATIHNTFATGRLSKVFADSFNRAYLAQVAQRDLAHRGWGDDCRQNVFGGADEKLTPAEYDARSAKLRREPLVTWKRTEYSNWVFARIVRAARAQGIEVVVIEAPWQGHPGRYGPELDGVPILSFDDAGAYPELFEARHHCTRSHLNPAGARLFSQELGARLAELSDRGTR